MARRGLIAALALATTLAPFAANAAEDAALPAPAPCPKRADLRPDSPPDCLWLGLVAYKEAATEMRTTAAVKRAEAAGANKVTEAERRRADRLEALIDNRPVVEREVEVTPPWVAPVVTSAVAVTVVSVVVAGVVLATSRSPSGE